MHDNINIEYVLYDHVIGPRQENAVRFYIISEHVMSTYVEKADEFTDDMTSKIGLGDFCSRL